MRLWILAVAAPILLAACGDSGGGDNPFGGAVPSGETSDAADLAAPNEGGGSATITIDGTVLHFTMDPVVYSPHEAIADATFEACSPNFFGVGMFYAIGYPVDENGELLLADNGDIAGALEIEIPPDDWEARGLDDGEPEFRIESDELGIEIRILSRDQLDELAPGAEHSWVITDDGVSGTAAFSNVRQDVSVVDFEATCR